MANLSGIGGPVLVAGLFVVVAVVVALAFVLWRRARARARAVRPPIPSTAPTAAEAAFLDSSHVFEGPIIGGANDREP